MKVKFKKYWEQFKKFMAVIGKSAAWARDR